MKLRILEGGTRIVSAPQVHERPQNELTEAQSDVIARIGMIEMRDRREACQTGFLHAPEAIA